MGSGVSRSKATETKIQEHHDHEFNQPTGLIEANEIFNPLCELPDKLQDDSSVDALWSHNRSNRRRKRVVNLSRTCLGLSVQDELEES